MPKALIAPAPNEAVLQAYAERPLAPGQMRLRLEYSAEKHGTNITAFRGIGTRGTWDPALQLFRGDDGGVGFPRALGNMGVGRVIEVGEAVEGVAVGERVFGYFPIRETHVVAAERVWPAVPGVSDELLVCTDPAAVGLRAVQESRLGVGERVAVFGLGAIGLMIVQLAKIAGAQTVIALDPLPERRQLAADRGADILLDPLAGDAGVDIKEACGKDGVDAAFETSGAYGALHQAIRSTRFGGSVVTVAVYHGDARALDLSQEWHLNRQVMIAGARVESEPYREYPRWDRARLYETVFHLFAAGRLSADGLLHTVSFEDSAEAFRTLANEPNRWVKLGVRYQGD